MTSSPLNYGHSDILQLVMTNTKEIIWAVDHNYCLLFANKKFQNAVVASQGKEKLPGENVLSGQYPKEFLEFWKNNYTKCFNNENIEVISIVPRPEGLQYVENFLSPLKDEYGLNCGAMVVSRDITEKKKIEQALKESEEKYRLLFNIESDALFVLNKDTWAIVDVNNSATQLYGFSREELLKMKAIELSAEPKKSIDAAKNNTGLIPLRYHRKKDGSVFPVEITFNDFEYQNHSLRIVAVRDNTIRNKAEKALSESETNLRKAQELAHIGSWKWDISTDHVYWSEELFRLHSLQSKPQAPAFAHQDASSTSESKEKLKEVLAKSLQNGELYEIELDLISLPDKNIKHALAWGEPDFDSDGKIIGFHGTIQDITARKNAEIELIRAKEKAEKSEMELRKKNKANEELTEKLKQTNEQLLIAKEKAEENDLLKTAFLQNMSHEIRTPMNAIMGFSRLLIQHYNNKPKIEKFSGIINNSCRDLLEIINDILDISKIESGQLLVHIEKANLNTLFTELSLFFKEYQKRIGKQHIVFSLKNHASRLGDDFLTDIGKLRQILINLIGNAFKYTETGSIACDCRLDSNNYLIFQVSDTGIGIPADKQEIIFERFAQLKNCNNEAHRGTGLGLPIVKGLVDLLGGEVWLESELGKGSTFKFSIPYKTPD